MSQIQTFLFTALPANILDNETLKCTLKESGARFVTAFVVKGRSLAFVKSNGDLLQNDKINASLGPCKVVENDRKAAKARQPRNFKKQPINDEKEEGKNESTMPATQHKLEDCTARELYVRGLPLDCTPGQLKNHFVANFGLTVQKAWICNKNGDSGFIRFDKPESVESVLKYQESKQRTSTSQSNSFDVVEQLKAKLLKDASSFGSVLPETPLSQENNLLLFDGTQKMTVSRVIKNYHPTSKDTKNVKDSFTTDELMQACLPPSKYPAYAERLKALQLMRARVKQSGGNLQFSKKRLSIRHLPKGVTEARLKSFFRESLLPKKDDPVYIKQTKLVMDEDGKSKGFGFVEFYEEKDALKALRAINSSDSKWRLLIGNAVKMMPVAEWAIEKTRVLIKKQDTY